MKIGVLGTGTVGTTIATKLVELGHEVKLGSRTADNPKSAEWAKGAGAKASQGTFADAAAFGEIVFNCTKGEVALAVLDAAGASNLARKILVDVTNPLDASKGMPPSLSVCNTDSLAEQIQRALPETKVVKTLNTVNASVMVNPSLVKGAHDMFVSGNDAASRGKVSEILTGWFGWKNVVDLGDLTGARAQEMIVVLWVRLYMAFQSPTFGLHVTR